MLKITVLLSVLSKASQPCSYPYRSVGLKSETNWRYIIMYLKLQCYMYFPYTLNITSCTCSCFITMWCTYICQVLLQHIYSCHFTTLYVFATPVTSHLQYPYARHIISMCFFQVITLHVLSTSLPRHSVKFSNFQTTDSILEKMASIVIEFHMICVIPLFTLVRQDPVPDTVPTPLIIFFLSSEDEWISVFCDFSTKILSIRHLNILKIDLTDCQCLYYHH